MDLDDALEAVDGAANPEWKRLARRCAEWLTATRPDGWTCDDIWYSMAHYYPDVETPEPRALGPIMQSIIRDGLVERVGITKSTRPVHHEATLFVYRRKQQ